jgi:hypothetical protein
MSWITGILRLLGFVEYAAKLWEAHKLKGAINEANKADSLSDVDAVERLRKDWER